MSLVGLGRAFNLKYRPNGPLRFNCYQRQMPIMFGGDRNVSITENYNIQTTPGGLLGGIMGFSEGWFTGGFLANSIMCLFERFGVKAKSQGETNPTATGNSSKLKDLQDLFKSKGAIIKETSPGKFTATIDGKSIGKDLSYDDMYEALDGYNKEEKDPKVKEGKEGKELTEEQKIAKAASENDPPLIKNDKGEWIDKNGNRYEYKDGKFNKLESQQELGDRSGSVPGDKSVKGSQRARRSGGASSAGGAGGADEAKGAKSSEWTAEKKAKPYRLQMVVAISGNNVAATVVTPDGKTYKVNTTASGLDGKSDPTDNDARNRARLDTVGKALLAKLRDAGWTNVTLENKNFNWSSDGKGATGKVDKSDKAKEWTKEKKAAYNKPHNIQFSVWPSRGYSGSATVTTPDGQIHQVTTTPSMGASNARKDLAKQMVDLLKSRGWTKATVTNSNWPEDCNV